jgi:holo-[acyl-carrier protein] synthase
MCFPSAGGLIFCRHFLFGRAGSPCNGKSFCMRGGGATAVSKIIGIGIDLVEVFRIEKVMTKYPDRFRARIFSKGEIEYCETRKNRFQNYAARFAAKEAAMKALGTGWREGIAFSEIEVVQAESGKPNLVFHGTAEKIFRDSGAACSFLSLSHTASYAVAQVVLAE